MEKHIKQTAIQGGHVQGQDFAPYTRAVTGNQLRVEQKSGGTYEPQWIMLLQPAQNCRDLMSCKCKIGCVKCCNCASVRESVPRT
jgi:hypothetical protein